MIASAPKPLFLGAFALAAVAGYINAIAILSPAAHSVSHVSGTASSLGIALSGGDLIATGTLLGLISAFVFGAFLCGLFIRQAVFQLGRRYGVALILEALLIVLSTSFLEQGNVAGLFVLATACGLQNAMVSTYSGAIVRTTHVTGVATDFGVFLGRIASGQPADYLRLLLYMLLLSGFVIGSALGAVAFANAGVQALKFAAMATGLVAAAYMLLRPTSTPL